MAAEDQDSIRILGELNGHTDWVTCLATADNPKLLLTGSRDKSIVVWELQTQTSDDQNADQTNFYTTTEFKGKMLRRLVGHNHFVSDISVSSDKQYALSSSWDGTLRLWNLKTGETATKFKGHKKDVLSVAFSADNTRIISGSRDRDIKVWNTIGKEQAILSSSNNNDRMQGGGGAVQAQSQGHSDWVTCVRVSPSVDEPMIVSCGRDGLVKVWDMNKQYKVKNLDKHSSYVNSVTVSPDGSLCASGGKDGLAILWDLNEGKHLSSLKAEGEIMALCFSPNRYWLCGAVVDFVSHESHIKIWDLETKDEIGKLRAPSQDEEDETKKKKKKARDAVCTCLTWSQDGRTLFAGYTDCSVKIWSLISGSNNEIQMDQ